MPLYGEEIHLITRKDLKLETLDDFKNLKVSVGKEGSGTFITTTNFAKYTGARWKKTFTKDIKDSLMSLKNGELDAAFYVSGTPAKIFNIDESDKVFNLYKNNFKLVDISKYKALDDKYYSSKILKKDYPWMDKSINTKSVTSVLVTYNYKPHQPSYKRVQSIYQCIYDNLSLFQEKHHPKWNEVDPTDFRGINWKIHDSVLEILDTLKLKNEDRKTIEMKNEDKKNDDVLENFFDNL